MRDKTIPLQDCTQQCRAKAALALAMLLSLALIGFGISGMQAFTRSGFDDAPGFSHIWKAARIARDNARADHALVTVFPQEQQEKLRLQLDDAIHSLWRQVRFRGETIQDFKRGDMSSRKQMLSGLLRETNQDTLKVSAQQVADALELLRSGLTPDGLPAYEQVLLDLMKSLPVKEADLLQEKLASDKKQSQAEVEQDTAHRAQALFEEAVAERRLSRFVNGGAGVIPLVQQMYRLLIASKPDADISALMPLLMDVPRDQELYLAIAAQSVEIAFPEVLEALDPQNLSGAKLLAFSKALYAALKEQHPDIFTLDHQPLLELQIQALNLESGQTLQHQVNLLKALAWNERLAPLLQEGIEKCKTQGDASQQMLLEYLEAVLDDQSPEDMEDQLALQLMEARDQDTQNSIADYLADLPMETADQSKLSLLTALLVFQDPKLPSQAVKQLDSLNEEQRVVFRSQLLLALADSQETLPSWAEEALTGKEETREEELLHLFLISRDYKGSLLGEETGVGLRLAVRQNAPRIRAARMIAQGSGSQIEAFVSSHGKTLVLIGALVLIDTLLLFFLMQSGRDWRFDAKWLMILAIVDFMLVFQVLPLLYLLFRAFTPEGTFSLITFGRLFSYNMNCSALINTILGGFLAMVLGTLLAFPLAWMVGRSNMYGKKFFRALFIVTYMVPPYVGAMAWLRLLNPNVGTINVFLRGLFGLNMAEGPINVYSLGGLVWVLTTFYYPYAFITISRAMEKMDPSLEEASRISGASPFVTLMRVTLPIMTPSLIAGALLVFVSAASCYGIPSIIGAPGRVHTVTTRIIEYYGRGTQGLNDATGLAVFLMTLAILILYLSDFVVAKKQYITVSGKSTRPNIVDLRSWRLPLTILVALFAVLVVLIPFTTILTTSLKIDVGKSLFADGNFTFEQWTGIFSRSETLDSLKNSLIYAAVAATVGILVAITMSYLMQRTRIRGRKLPDFLITLGSGSPSVVIALGLIMSMQDRFGVNIYNTAYILIVAYLIKYMMMGMRTVTSAISQIHVSLEESSQVSGASWVSTMCRITGPLIFPSIAAGWFLIFIPCFYELSMTTLLYTNSTKTIGFQLYEYWTYTSQPQASALAFGILLIVIMINQFFNRITKGEFTI